MAKVSLDDLRKGTPIRLAERSYALCVRRDLLAEVDSLQEEIGSALVEDDREGKPALRYGEGGESPRVREIRERLGKLYDEITDNTGELRLRAITDGEWRRWVGEHPAREKNDRDEQVAYGLCDADALIADLGSWVLSWEGDPLAKDDWATVFAPGASGGDLKQIARLVVELQEATEDPKWRLRALLGGQASSVTEPSPEQ